MKEFHEVRLQAVATLFNRSLNQVQFLYKLVGCNIKVYLDLEQKIKMHNLFNCPSTMEEVKKVLELPNIETWFGLLNDNKGTRIKMTKSNSALYCMTN